MASSSCELTVAIFIHLKKIKFLYGSAVVVVVAMYPTYVCTSRRDRAKWPAYNALESGDREGRRLLICTRGEFVSERDSYPFLSNAGLHIHSYRTHAGLPNESQLGIIGWHRGDDYFRVF